MLLSTGKWVDACIEEYYGVQAGSRHLVTLGVPTDTGDVVDNVILDLNESNHGKLLFSSVARYSEARMHFAAGLLTKSSTIRDDVVARDLQVADQRIYLECMDSRRFARASQERDSLQPLRAATSDQKLPRMCMKSPSENFELMLRQPGDEELPLDEALSSKVFGSLTLTSFIDDLISDLNFKVRLVQVGSRHEQELVHKKVSWNI